MDELVAFLRAALDRDEQVVRQMLAEPGGFYLEAETDDVNIMTVGAYVQRWQPKRVLAEVQAKRTMLDFLDPTCAPEGEGKYVAEQAILLLAQPYAGQPGWREEWQLSVDG